MLSHSKSGIVPQLVNQFNDRIVEHNLLCQTITLRNNSIESNGESVAESDVVIRDQTVDNNSFQLTNKELNESVNVSQVTDNSCRAAEKCNENQSGRQNNHQLLELKATESAVVPVPNNRITETTTTKDSLKANECNLNRNNKTPEPIDPDVSQAKHKLIAINVNPVLDKLMARRRHTFVSKTIVPKEICGVCGDCIQFAEKYRQCVDCIAISHMDCSSQLPVPCIRYTNPNLKPSKVISNYVYPSFKPSIPAIVIHCIREIEQRCHESLPNTLYIMNSEGLRQVKDLCNNCIKTQNGFPILNKFNINIVCGVLKKFLSDFNESLIGRDMWKQFSYNMKKKSDDELDSMVKQLIMELNTTNRDTLSLLIIHLRHLADNQKYICLDDLTHVFCPIVCGDTEVNRKLRLMSCLLQIRRDFWLNILIK